MTNDNEQPPSRDKEQWKRFLAEELSKISNQEEEEAFYRLLNQYTKEVLGLIPIEVPDLSLDEINYLYPEVSDMSPDEINKFFPPEIASKLIDQNRKDADS